MNLYFKIHRGTNEIGGSCVEIWNDSTRIVIDLGLPLVEKDKSEFDFSKYKNHSISELISEKILPDIPGLYAPAERKVDAVIISHPHIDHFGLLNYVSPDVPVYMGRATNDLINISSLFTPVKIELKRVVHFDDKLPFKIGDFRIQAFMNDHSAFDSYMLLIECEGKRILYTGDFRGHGRKSYMMQKFIENPPTNIDYLILEGTAMGRVSVMPRSEEDIEKELFRLFKEDKFSVVYTSGQNLDRLVSIFKASHRAKKTLVLDLYTAHILKAMAKYGKFPYPKNGFGIKVLHSSKTSAELKKPENKDFLCAFKDYKIRKEEIQSDSAKYVLIVKGSLMSALRAIKISNGNFIHSLWRGYKDKKSVAEIRDYFIGQGLTSYDIHTGGHADTEYLRKFANAVNPKHIIPIHTFSKGEYKSIFAQNIIELEDKQSLRIEN